MASSGPDSPPDSDASAATAPRASVFHQELEFSCAHANVPCSNPLRRSSSSSFSPMIQALRLHYVEFFSKFYEGGGQPFRPFGARVTP